MGRLKNRREEFQPWRGVFETLKVIDGVPLFWHEHKQSLRESATILGLKFPSEKALRAVSLGKSEGRLRWVLDLDGFRSLFMPEKKAPLREWSLAVASVRVGSRNWDARYKTLSYLSHWQARSEKGTADEVILFNEKGEVASASMANIFWVKAGQIFTPRPDCGCRGGVIRGWVKSRYRVKEGHYYGDELNHADEIFLTNSIIGVVRVTRFKRRRNLKGPIVTEIQTAYEQQIADLIQSPLKIIA